MSLEGNPDLVTTRFDSPASNPLELFRHWLDEARRVSVREPFAMALATVNSEGHPSSRVVLMKECDHIGVIFGTSAKSRKGQDLCSNNWGAGTLHWRETIQQICFRGPIVRLPDSICDELFSDRNIEAQAVAACSMQSEPLVSKQMLRSRVEQMIKAGKPIERPQHWGAYRLEIQEIEFWQGRPDRFHDRLLYQLKEGHWSMQWLQP